MSPYCWCIPSVYLLRVLLCVYLHSSCGYVVFVPEFKFSWFLRLKETRIPSGQGVLYMYMCVFIYLYMYICLCVWLYSTHSSSSSSSSSSSKSACDCGRGGVTTRWGLAVWSSHEQGLPDDCQIWAGKFLCVRVCVCVCVFCCLATSQCCGCSGGQYTPPLLRRLHFLK